MSQVQSVSWEASRTGFLYRQLFVTPKATSSKTLNLDDHVGIITGSNVGLGLECSRQLLGLGLSRLILAVRDETKGHVAKEYLARNAPLAEIEVWKLDMSSYDSITTFVQRCKTLPRLDFAVLNAGVFKTTLELNPTTGHEETLQVNYLSTALLTILMLPVLKKKNTPQRPGRITIVGSETAAWCNFKEQDSFEILTAFNDPNLFDMKDRYATSKLLEQLFLSQLVKLVPSSAVIVNMANPGLNYGSNLQHEIGGVLGMLSTGVKRVLGRHAAVGARTLTDAAVNHGTEVHGKYLGDCQIKPMAPFVYTKKGEAVAEKLWEETLLELAFVNARDIISQIMK